MKTKTRPADIRDVVMKTKIRPAEILNVDHIAKTLSSKDKNATAILYILQNRGFPVNGTLFLEPDLDNYIWTKTNMADSSIIFEVKRKTKNKPNHPLKIELINKLRFKLIGLLVGNHSYIKNFFIQEGSPLGDVVYFSCCQIGDNVTTRDGVEYIKANNSGGVYTEAKNGL